MKQQEIIKAITIRIGEEGPFSRYDICKLEDLNNIEIQDKMGVFVFTKREPQENGSYNHAVCYIGESNNLPNLSLSKEIQEKLFTMGVNCIAIKFCSSAEELSEVKSKYVDFWHPQLN